MLTPSAAKMPVAVVRCSRLGSALAEAVALKSYVPGAWQVSQSFRTPGNVTSANGSVVLEACQVNGTVRLADAWIEWMKLVESAVQPLLVRLGLWHHEQVVPSLRCPPWKASSVKAP